MIKSEFSPLVEIDSVRPGARIFAKIEGQSVTGSIKDRLAAHIFKNLVNTKKIEEIDTIIEASSGNTGASIAYYAKKYGLKSKIFIPHKTSIEKASLIELYGAELVRVSAEHPFMGETDYCKAAKLCRQELPRSYFIDQYNSPLNSECHYLGIGNELVSQCPFEIDYFVSVASTGGTISGVGKRLKEAFPNIKNVIADPVGSVIYPKFHQHHDADTNTALRIEGAGKKYITKVLDLSLIDDVIQFQYDDTLNVISTVLEKKQFLFGYTGGANISVCQKIAERTRGNINIVTVIPDFGYKYTQRLNTDFRAMAL